MTAAIAPTARRPPLDLPLAAAGLVVVVAGCAVLLPNGLPGGVALRGVLVGCHHALIAAGLLLVYRATRIVNFAGAVIGGVGSVLLFELGAVGIQDVGRAPLVVALLAGVLASALLGAATELVFVRRFFSSPRLVLTVVTIVMAPTVGALPLPLRALPLWQSGPDVATLRGTLDYPEVLPSFRFRVSPFNFDVTAVLTLVLTIASLVALGMFLGRSRLGAAIRGSAENADRALLLGINVRLLSTIVWAMAGVLSGLAGCLALLDGASIGEASSLEPSYLLPALAALVLARMRSLPVAIVATVGLGVLGQAILWSYAGSRLFDVLVLGIVLAGLLVQRPGFSRVDAAASSWKATEEIRPTPPPLLAVPGVRRSRWALLAVVGAVVLVFPQIYSAGQAELASRIAINVVIALSLVVLTGWGGQVSLGQAALVGAAAVLSGWLAGRGLPFWVILPIVVAASSGLALCVGLPALRVRGPFLAVATLAFAEAFHGGLDGGPLEGLVSDRIERPSLLVVSFAGERSYYYLCLAGAVLAAIVVRRLRAGRPGRVLIAIREDELGLQPFGIHPGRSRTAVFALSGALAGLAGVLLLYLTRGMDPKQFTPVVGVDLFIMAMVGGVTSVTGAVLGAVYVGLTGFLIDDDALRRLSTGVGLLALLFISPGGLAAIAYACRDAVWRIVAVRRHLLIPGLRRDVDPDDPTGARLGLTSARPGRGLDALPHQRRYALRSGLYDSEAR